MEQQQLSVHLLFLRIKHYISIYLINYLNSILFGDNIEIKVFLLNLEVFFFYLTSDL